MLPPPHWQALRERAIASAATATHIPITLHAPRKSCKEDAFWSDLGALRMSYAPHAKHIRPSAHDLHRCADARELGLRPSLAPGVAWWGIPRRISCSPGALSLSLSFPLRPRRRLRQTSRELKAPIYSHRTTCKLTRVDACSLHWLQAMHGT